MALYTDRAHWAFQTPQANGPVDKTRLTQVGRALARLGIEHIPAYSPQARGRSERLNRTFQDRLVNELRVAGITTLPAANRYLRDRFVPDYNATFSCAPGDPASAFVAAGRGRSRADPLSRGGAARRARQHRHLRAAARSSSRAAGPPHLRGPQVTVRRHLRAYSIWSGTRPLGQLPALARDRAIAGRPCSLWKLPQPWTPRTRPPLLGKRPEPRFPQLPQASALGKAVRSLVKRKRTDHLSTTGADAFL